MALLGAGLVLIAPACQSGGGGLPIGTGGVGGTGVGGAGGASTQGGGGSAEAVCPTSLFTGMPCMTPQQTCASTSSICFPAGCAGSFPKTCQCTDAKTWSCAEWECFGGCAPMPQTGGQGGAGGENPGVGGRGGAGGTTALGGAPGSPVTCQLEEVSDLPGVHIHVKAENCVFTLAQARAGISIPYEIVVDHDLEVVPKAPPGSYCYQPGPSGLLVGAILKGSGNQYCLCDQGLPYATFCSQPSAVRAGVYSATFDWDGVNWFGPSDTVNPKGAPFPPGTYRLDITAKGLRAEADAGNAPFTVSASFAVVLVD